MNESTESDHSNNLPPEGLMPPKGLNFAMEGLAREVLLKNPINILEFAAEYFEKLLYIRNLAAVRGENSELKDLIIQHRKNSMNQFENGSKVKNLNSFISPPKSNGGLLTDSSNNNIKRSLTVRNSLDKEGEGSPIKKSISPADPNAAFLEQEIINTSQVEENLLSKNKDDSWAENQNFRLKGPVLLNIDKDNLDGFDKDDPKSPALIISSDDKDNIDNDTNFSKTPDPLFLDVDKEILDVNHKDHPKSPGPMFMKIDEALSDKHETDDPSSHEDMNITDKMSSRNIDEYESIPNESTLEEITDLKLQSKVTSPEMCGEISEENKEVIDAIDSSSVTAIKNIPENENEEKDSSGAIIVDAAEDGVEVIEESIDDKPSENIELEEENIDTKEVIENVNEEAEEAKDLDTSVNDNIPIESKELEENNTGIEKVVEDIEANGEDASAIKEEKSLEDTLVEQNYELEDSLDGIIVDADEGGIEVVTESTDDKPIELEGENIDIEKVVEIDEDAKDVNDDDTSAIKEEKSLEDILVEQNDGLEDFLDGIIVDADESGIEVVAESIDDKPSENIELEGENIDIKKLVEIDEDDKEVNDDDTSAVKGEILLEDISVKQSGGVEDSSDTTIIAVDEKNMDFKKIIENVNEDGKEIKDLDTSISEAKTPSQEPFNEKIGEEIECATSSAENDIDHIKDPIQNEHIMAAKTEDSCNTEKDEEETETSNLDNKINVENDDGIILRSANIEDIEIPQAEGTIDENVSSNEEAIFKELLSKAPEIYYASVTLKSLREYTDDFIKNEITMYSNGVIPNNENNNTSNNNNNTEEISEIIVEPIHTENLELLPGENNENENAQQSPESDASNKGVYIPLHGPNETENITLEIQEEENDINEAPIIFTKENDELIQELISLNNLEKSQVVQVLHSTIIDNLNDDKKIDCSKIETNILPVSLSTEEIENKNIDEIKAVERIELTAKKTHEDLIATESDIKSAPDSHSMSDIKNITLDLNLNDIPELVKDSDVSNEESENKDSKDKDQANLFEKASVLIQKVFRGFQVRKIKPATIKFEEKILQHIISPNPSTYTEKSQTTDNVTALNDMGKPQENVSEAALYTVPEEKNGSLSTEEESSTFSSAATKIQAGVRGFLTRKCYQQAKTYNSSDTTAPSIGEDSRSLDEGGNINDGQSSSDDTIRKMIIATSSLLMEQIEHFEKLEQKPTRSSIPNIEFAESIREDDEPTGTNQIRRRLKREDAIQVQSLSSSGEINIQKAASKKSDDDEPIGDLAQSIITEIVSSSYSPYTQAPDNLKSPISDVSNVTDNELEDEVFAERNIDNPISLVYPADSNNSTNDLLHQAKEMLLKLDISNSDDDDKDTNNQDNSGHLLQELSDGYRKITRESSVQSDDCDVIIAPKTTHMFSARSPKPMKTEPENVEDTSKNLNDNKTIPEAIIEDVKVVSAEIEDAVSKVEDEIEPKIEDIEENLPCFEALLEKQEDEKELLKNTDIGELNEIEPEIKKSSKVTQGLLHTGEFHDAIVLPTKIDRKTSSSQKE